MRRRLPLLLAILLIPAASLGQSNSADSSDSQTLRALLTEVRQLRQELQSSLAKVESAQILLARLQAQQATVAHASQRLDELHEKLVEAQDVERRQTASLKEYQEQLSSEDNPSKQKDLQEVMDQLKQRIEATTNMEQQRQTTEMDAEQQLRIEQGKLDTLQAQLDEIVKSLNAAPGSSSH